MHSNLKLAKLRTKQYLVIKEDEDIRREEDFIPLETDFKQMQLFMLSIILESFYSMRAKAEEKEQARL